MATQLCSELGRIDPEKLLQYRATFICQYGLCCCIVWPSFLVDCTVRKNLGNLREFFGQIVYRPPLAKNFPYAYVSPSQPLGLESRSFWITDYSLPVSTCSLRGILLIHVNRNTCCPISKKLDEKKNSKDCYNLAVGRIF